MFVSTPRLCIEILECKTTNLSFEISSQALGTNNELEAFEEGSKSSWVRWKLLFDFIFPQTLFRVFNTEAQIIIRNVAVRGFLFDFKTSEEMGDGALCCRGRLLKN